MIRVHGLQWFYERLEKLEERLAKFEERLEKLEGAATGGAIRVGSKVRFVERCANLLGDERRRGECAVVTSIGRGGWEDGTLCAQWSEGASTVFINNVPMSCVELVEE